MKPKWSANPNPTDPPVSGSNPRGAWWTSGVKNIVGVRPNRSGEYSGMRLKDPEQAPTEARLKAEAKRNALRAELAELEKLMRR